MKSFLYKISIALGKYIEYIMRHYKRDMKNLILIIDKLDKVSLSEGKPVSLNLIKRVTTDLKIF